MDFTIIVYWIIITLYVVIATITILALIGKVDIKPSYMKVLFTKVIVGIIGGFMYLFYGSGEVSFNRDPADVFTYDRTGRAVSFSVYQGDSAVAVIKPPTSDLYKSVQRSYRKVENKIYLLNSDSSYLGYIEMTGSNNEGFISIENKLHLGLYYAQNKSKPGYGNLAVKYLIEVLKQSDNAPELADAVKGLYQVVNSINTAGDFKLLLSKMKIYLTPPSKYYEIAETFRVYFNATNTDGTLKNLGSLRNYLLYFINTPESLHADRAVVKAKYENMVSNILYYSKLLKGKYPILTDTAQIESDLKNYNVDKLQTIIDLLPIVSLDNLDPK